MFCCVCVRALIRASQTSGMKQESEDEAGEKEINNLSAQRHGTSNARSFSNNFADCISTSNQI